MVRYLFRTDRTEPFSEEAQPAEQPPVPAAHEFPSLVAVPKTTAKSKAKAKISKDEKAPTKDTCVEAAPVESLEFQDVS